MNLPSADLRRRSIPSLENGDRLTADEFMRRYEAMPEIKKAELIEGVVYMPSPVTNDHAYPHAHIIGWLLNYEAFTPVVQVSDNATLVLVEGESRPQPDAVLRLLPKAGGRARVKRGGYILGAPELVAEVAVSSVSFDLHDKKRTYERNGVDEYIVWQFEDARIDWFRLRGGKYHSLRADSQGLLRSEVFPGLWLDRAAMLKGNLRQMLKTLQRGIQSSEHKAFVARRPRKDNG